ncbi:MAG: ABC transporter, partial [Acidobacteria bacterium]|nr:ABC transporter [Acidobacteriota bacterium]
MTRLNDPRGSIWRKWDLHIHTPASFHWNDGKTFEKMTEHERNKSVDKIINRMEALDVAAFGIMDYWTFDGYSIIRERVKQTSPSFSKAIFPGMELRIEAPVDFRLNIHVLLSDDLSAQKLGDFKSALRIRIGKDDRSLSNESLIEFASSLDASKAQFHGFSQKDLKDENNLLKLGSMTANVTRDSLQNAIAQLPERTALIILPYDTSNGLMKLDWKSFPSDDNYFMTSAHIFETRDSKNIDLCLGKETKENSAFIENFMKSMGGKPKPAISGSDAHKIKDYGVFPSGKVTWIKADPTFQGLLQVVNEPEERSFIGESPTKLEHVKKHPTKYIDRLEIKKNPDATVTEKWFDNELVLNPGLISIIGNKGNGKSALVDIVGLLAET